MATFKEVLFQDIDHRSINLKVVAHRGEVYAGITAPEPLSVVNSVLQTTLPNVIPVSEAIKAAISLADETGLPIDVYDPDRNWRPEWGQMERRT